MTGESGERTGARALLERAPDPGALLTLAPDFHTPWGTTPVAADDIVPSGLAVIARSALADVCLLATDWAPAEHPYEGGSDHQVFLERDIPAVLFWHFTDFAYHTSLDRLEHVDAGEMQRTGAALFATALALADPLPLDLDRYLWSLRLETDLRVGTCEAAGASDVAERWRAWSKGARWWLCELCLGG
jgi:hypothetical protein